MLKKFLREGSRCEFSFVQASFSRGGMLNKFLREGSRCELSVVLFEHSVF